MEVRVIEVSDDSLAVDWVAATSGDEHVLFVAERARADAVAEGYETARRLAAV